MLAADYPKIQKSLRIGANPNAKLFGKFNIATVATALYKKEHTRAKARPLILPLLKRYGAAPQPLSSAETAKLNHFVKTLKKRGGARMSRGQSQLAQRRYRAMFVPLLWCPNIQTQKQKQKRQKKNPPNTDRPYPNLKP